MHEASPGGDKRDRVVKAEGAGGDQGGELAQAVAGYEGWLALQGTALQGGGEAGQRDGQNRRLGVGGFPQFLVRALNAELR